MPPVIFDIDLIQLQKPSLELVNSYLEFITEMKNRGEKIWELSIPRPEESLEMFIDRLTSEKGYPEKSLVPETRYWVTLNNQVVGKIGLRHELNENLAEFGGHIGYEVRPSFRRKGTAKEILKRVLQTPKAKEIGKLLLTCSPDNIASIKTILSNGGILTKTVYVEKWQRYTSYYWINLKT
jgi:predicted acetyltransferase